MLIVSDYLVLHSLNKKGETEQDQGGVRARCHTAYTRNGHAHGHMYGRAGRQALLYTACNSGVGCL